MILHQAPEVLDLRLTLLRGGYTPLPLFGKAPPIYGKNNKLAGLEGWQKLGAVTEGQLKSWAAIWPDAVNTGVLTQHAPAFDADIVSPEAAEAVEELVRELYEERGHLMVRIGLPPKRAFLFQADAPFKKTAIAFTGTEEKLEFLCDGQQVVVAGIHPETQRPYAWFGGEPWNVRRDELPLITQAEAVELMERAAELLVGEFGYVRAGGRPKQKPNGPEPVGEPCEPTEDARRGPYGQAAMAGLESELAAAPSGSRNDTANLIGFRAGQLVGGGCLDQQEAYSRLEAAALSWGISPDDKALGPRGTIWRAILDGMEHPRGPNDGDEEPDDIEPAKQATAVLDGLDANADWTYPEGLLGEIADWIMLTSRRPNRPLAVASAVATLSAVCGRWLYGPTGSALNVYVACLAPTAVGKDRPLAAPGAILAAANLHRLHTTAKGFSVGALEQLMIDHPCCVATVDEIGASLLARMSHKHASTHEVGMRAVLLELWSRDQFKGPFDTTRHALGRGVKVPTTISIPRPNLTVLGASTPEAFFAAVSAGSVRDGFLNRFLICAAAPRGKAQEVREEDGKVPQSIVRALQDLVPDLSPFGNIAATLGVYALEADVEPVVRRLPWDSDEALKRAQELEERILVAIDSDPETAPLLGRVFEYSVRLASLHAVSRDGLNARVTMADLSWGTAWAVQSARAMVESVAGLMASSDYEAKFNTIRNVIKENGEITRRELLRLVRSINARERDEIIGHLIGAGWVAEVKITTKGRMAQGWKWL